MAQIGKRTMRILTSIITERTYSLSDANKILPSERRGCEKRFCWKTVAPSIEIDNKKAFDCVPHTWILKSFKCIKYL